MQENVLDTTTAMSSELPNDALRTNFRTICHEPAESAEPAENNDSKRTHTDAVGVTEPRPGGKSRKRRKKSSQPSSFPHAKSIRSDIYKSAESLRRGGISPDTLFFPSLSDDMKRDENLRTVISVPLENLKTTHVRGKKMAWAKFENESDCLDTILRLKLSNPGVKVSLHRPKNVTHSNGMSLASNSQNTFQKRLEEVRRNGGVGNTLMFRNFPKEVECDELREVLREAVEKTDCKDDFVPLRIRTAVSKNGNGRNFWVMYSSVTYCQAAFVAIHLKSVRFRCGRTIKIHAFVHDDSTDADEKRRRERAIDLGAQGSAPASEVDPSAHNLSNLDRLENLLRQSQTSFVFMSPKRS